MWFIHISRTHMAHDWNDDDEDFWRPSVKQRLELQRAQRRSREAEGWRRNFLGMLVLLRARAGRVGIVALRLARQPMNSPVWHLPQKACAISTAAF